MNQKMQITCYMCGLDFDSQMTVTKLSDEYTIVSGEVKWQYKKYCSGDGTLKCAEVESHIRRGPMYEAWLDDPSIIDACDS